MAFWPHVYGCGCPLDGSWQDGSWQTGSWIARSWLDGSWLGEPGLLVGFLELRTGIPQHYCGVVRTIKIQILKINDVGYCDTAEAAAAATAVDYAWYAAAVGCCRFTARRRGGGHRQPP